MGNIGVPPLGSKFSNITAYCILLVILVSVPWGVMLVILLLVLGIKPWVILVLFPLGVMLVI